MELPHEPAQPNYTILHDCLAEPIIHKSAPAPRNATRRKPKGRKTPTSITLTSNATATDTCDAADLADFVDYMASETFASLPPELQTLSHAAIRTEPRVATTYASPLPSQTLSTLLAGIPPSVPDSLTAYGLLDLSTSSLSHFLAPVLQKYVDETTAPPPPLVVTHKADACEICERDWIPLTYHHLIPRSTYAKVLKRGWHEEWELKSVAWLCRACHGFVHGLCSNEQLAREWWSVELLLGREDVRGWAGWVGRVRWRKR